MEQSNKIERSEVWEQIYTLVKQISKEEYMGDAPDAPSVTTELEKLFLKLLSIHIQNVSGLLHIDKVADFIDYYNTLTSSQKCTVHPPAGSGAGYGIYNLSNKEILEKWLRKQ